MINFVEGAYYFKEFKFAWEAKAWVKTPSIFAIKNDYCIHIPYPKGFMQVEMVPALYFPFLYEELKVSVLDDKI